VARAAKARIRDVRAVRVVVRVVLVDASRVPDAERVDPVAATVDRPRPRVLRRASPQRAPSAPSVRPEIPLIETLRRQRPANDQLEDRAPIDRRVEHVPHVPPVPLSRQ
jgi:hypothetical protein